VSINPILLAEFSIAPPTIRDKLQQLEQGHQADFENLLKEMAVDEVEVDDPRPEETPPNPQPTGTDLPTYESMAALKAAVEIVNEVKSFDDKAVTILEDKLGAFYVVAKEDNHILKRASRLGSVGGGRLAPAETDARTGIVPFSLPSGDKTLVEVQLTSGPEAENEEGASSAKFKRGSLYMMIKSLQKTNGMKDISITGYGTMKPVTGGGAGDKHGFQLGPLTEDHHYILKAKGDSKISFGNCFRNLANKSPLEGGAAWMWRFQWSEVHSKLTARKPFLTAKQDMRLEKNKPVKIAWNNAAS
jgi:hypothetical protein